MKFHYRWVGTPFCCRQLALAAARLFKSVPLELIGITPSTAAIGNDIPKRMSLTSIVKVLLIPLLTIWTSHAAAAIIFSNTHSYEFQGDPSAIVINVEVYDNYFGNYNKYLWQYKVTNNSYNPNPGISNGFSGFETALPAGVPDLADLVAPNANWIFDCCSGQPVEWDIRNSAGNGVLPGQMGVFSFTSRPRFITQSAGWFHTWEFNSQTNIVNYPAGNGIEVPDVLATTAQLDQVTAIGNAVTVSVGASPTGSAPVAIETEVRQGIITQIQRQTIAVGDSAQQVFSGLQNNVPATVTAYVLDSQGNRALTAAAINATPQAVPETCKDFTKPLPPILLLHGFNSDKSIWLNTETQLKQCVGVSKVESKTLSDGFGALYENPFNQLRPLANWINDVKLSTGASRVILVGHSQGGILARLYTQAGGDPMRFCLFYQARSMPPVERIIANSCTNPISDGVSFFSGDQNGVAGIITYGTPHKGVDGVPSAYPYLARGSGFLQTLNDFQTFPIPVNILMTNIVGRTGTSATDDCLVDTDSQSIRNVSGYSGSAVETSRTGVKHATTNYGCLRAIGKTPEAQDFDGIAEALGAQILKINVYSPVDIVVTDPAGRTVSKSDRGIWGATYVEAPDETGDLKDVVTIPFPERGQYQILVIPDANASPTATFSISTEIDGQETMLVENVPVSETTSSPFFVTTSVSNLRPLANAGTDQIVECVGPSGTNVTLNGSASSDPDGNPLTLTWSGPFGTASGVTPTVTLPMGINTITLIVRDDKGGESLATVTVKVVDTTPPVINAVTATPNLLWPPNHKMIPVAVSVSTLDICSSTTTCMITSVKSNEPVNGTGDGDTAPDWEITGNLAVNLRAERAGHGSGRAYTLTVKCIDNSDNISTKEVFVNVPRNKIK